MSELLDNPPHNQAPELHEITKLAIEGLLEGRGKLSPEWVEKLAASVAELLPTDQLGHAVFSLVRLALHLSEDLGFHQPAHEILGVCHGTTVALTRLAERKKNIRNDALHQAKSALDRLAATKRAFPAKVGDRPPENSLRVSSFAPSKLLRGVRA